jgi:hypothetical protein
MSAQEPDGIRIGPSVASSTSVRWAAILWACWVHPHVERRLPATSLVERELDNETEPLKKTDRRFTDLWVERVN